MIVRMTINGVDSVLVGLPVVNVKEIQISCWQCVQSLVENVEEVHNSFLISIFKVLESACFPALPSDSFPQAKKNFDPGRWTDAGKWIDRRAC